MFDFFNQNVLITGAAGNLGQAAAEAFFAAGANLILVNRTVDSLEKAFPQWADAAGVGFFAADLTSEDDVAAAAGKILEVVGHIDVLVNIAGGFKMGDPVHKTDLKTWNFLLSLNAQSILLTARAFVPKMIERQAGKIINVGAQAGLEGHKNMAAYSVSKSAVMRLTESMSAELKSQGINVNCVLPDTIDTPINREAMPKADFSKWVTPADLAQIILFLASPAARPIHGAGIPA
ncbi:MAG: SDR family NAD(P)-dependent oxidoreductase [Ardenticatenaceae bacterium]|nr:SDR family NAD(P)-dependent oxidoreductase [Ardenticatenaceae bacterium]